MFIISYQQSSIAGLSIVIAVAHAAMVVETVNATPNTNLRHTANLITTTTTTVMTNPMPPTVHKSNERRPNHAESTLENIHDEEPSIVERARPSIKTATTFSNLRAASFKDDLTVPASLNQGEAFKSDERSLSTLGTMHDRTAGLHSVAVTGEITLDTNTDDIGDGNFANDKATQDASPGASSSIQSEPSTTPSTSPSSPTSLPSPSPSFYPTPFPSPSPSSPPSISTLPSDRLAISTVVTAPDINPASCTSHEDCSSSNEDNAMGLFGCGDEGRCVGCTSNWQCQEYGDGTLDFCDKDSNTCIAKCSENWQCQIHAKNALAACHKDGECTPNCINDKQCQKVRSNEEGNDFCDIDATSGIGICVADCTSHLQCRSNTNTVNLLACFSNTCIGCIWDYQCQNDLDDTSLGFDYCNNSMCTTKCTVHSDCAGGTHIEGCDTAGKCTSN